MVIIETDLFVLALSLRSASKVTSTYVMGVSHVNAERIGPYLDLNHYLDNSDKEIYFLIRNPYDRFISGLQRDLLVEGKTIEELHEYRKDNWYHGCPILQYIHDKEYKIIPYDSLSTYIDADNDEKFLKNFKNTHQESVIEYAKTVDLQAEFDAYDYIMNNKQILSPSHFKDMVSKSKLVNFTGVGDMVFW
tara:strand:- start:901 stop:1473 length:573 start_codon:yes stop_codon:yes gene_type:complete